MGNGRNEQLEALREAREIKKVRRQMTLDAVLKLARKGHTVTEIQTLLRVAHSTVRTALWQAGFTPERRPGTPGFSYGPEA